MFPEFEDLPTADDRVMPNPLENPPDKAEVGEDIRTTRFDRQTISCK